MLVGARPDSATYVRMKKKACAEAGIMDFGRDLPETATQAEVIAVVKELNANPDVDGILVQVREGAAVRAGGWCKGGRERGTTASHLEQAKE